jgi:hypothetical protein
MVICGHNDNETARGPTHAKGRGGGTQDRDLSLCNSQRCNKATTMAEEEEIAALVIDNGSGMCKGACFFFCLLPLE